MTYIGEWLLAWARYLSPPYTLTTIVVTVLCVLAARMMTFAVRGVPVLGAPRCSACGQAASTAGCERCAECGASLLGSALACGWRLRSWRLAAIASLLFAVAAALGAQFPGLLEVVANRGVLRVRLAMGVTGPNLINEAAGAIRARLDSGADAGDITDELFTLLGDAPSLRLRESTVARQLALDLGSLAIARQDAERTDALANALLVPPQFTVRRRHHPLADVCIDVDVLGGSGRTGFATTFVPLRTTIDGEPQTSKNIPGWYCDPRWVVHAPGDVGIHYLKIEWQQAVLPTLVPLPATSAGSSDAVWMRDGTFETVLEVVEPSEPVIEAVDDASVSPWQRGLPMIRQMELRDVDDRMLVTAAISPTLTPDLTFAGRWFVVQDGVERALHAEALRLRPIKWYFDYGGWQLPPGQSFISVRIDTTRPFRLVFKPSVVDAEAVTSSERCWSGETELTITPAMLTRDPIAADPTWVLTQR